MIGTDTISRVIGSDVYDESGEKIGSASEVYLDDETGAPEWITVRTGLFGTKESFVPIRDADLTDDGLRVHVPKERVKEAPRIDADGHLSPEEEQQLDAVRIMTIHQGNDLRPSGARLHLRELAHQACISSGGPVTEGVHQCVSPTGRWLLSCCPTRSIRV